MEGISRNKHIVNWLFFSNDENSVFRKTFRVFLFTLPAYMANLGLLYLAPRLVDGKTFGIFFLSNTIINWMYAPAIIISMYFLRDITNPKNIRDEHSLPILANRVIGLVGKWSAITMFVLGLLALILAWIAGVSSLFIIPIIFIITSFAYIGESIRVYLQAMDKYLLLGSFNMSWMVSRFLVGSTGLYIFQSAWGGLLGILIALGAVFLIYYMKFVRIGIQDVPGADDIHYTPSRLIKILPGILSYSTLILVCNIDIIVGYFVLDPSMLGVYSSSSVLAKAILVLAFPLTHSIYPALLSGENNIGHGSLIFLKGIIVTALIAGSVIGGLHVASGFICSSQYGIRGCEPDLYDTLIIPPFFLFLLVFLSLQSFSRSNDWVPLLLTIPAALFVLASFILVKNTGDLARLFTEFSIAVFVLYFVVVSGGRWIQTGGTTDTSA